MVNYNQTRESIMSKAKNTKAVRQETIRRLNNEIAIEQGKHKKTSSDLRTSVSVKNDIKLLDKLITIDNNIKSLKAQIAIIEAL